MPPPKALERGGPGGGEFSLQIFYRLRAEMISRQKAGKSSGVREAAYWVLQYYIFWVGIMEIVKTYVLDLRYAPLLSRTPLTVGVFSSAIEPKQG
jgi:hypothetical protein